MQQLLKLLLSVQLSLLLLFGGTVKEFVHGFAGHKDTIHSHENREGLQYEKQHHHCDFLNDVLPAFINNTFFPEILFHTVEYTAFQVPLTETFCFNITSIPSLRGPPTTC